MQRVAHACAVPFRRPGTTLHDLRASSRHLVQRNAQPRASAADNASAALSLQLARIAQQAANDRAQRHGSPPVQHIRGPAPSGSPVPTAPYQQMARTPQPVASAPPARQYAPSPTPGAQYHGHPQLQHPAQGYPRPQPGRSPHGNLPPVRAQPPTRRR